MPTTVHIVKAMVFLVVMWELDHKEGWAPKNWCFWIVVLEKTLGSPLDSKEIKPKGNQLWKFTRRTDTEAETLILWPPDAKSWLIGKTLMLTKIEGKRRRGWQRMRWLESITDAVDMSLSQLWEIVKDGEAMGSQQLKTAITVECFWFCRFSERVLGTRRASFGSCFGVC